MNHGSTGKGSITGEEIAKHNSKESCWVIVHGKAYDVTEFLPGMIPPIHDHSIDPDLT